MLDMFLETSGLWKLAHKKSDFYESSSRHNEPKSELSKNIYNRTNSSISGQPLLFTYLSPTKSSLCSRERATLLSYKLVGPLLRAKENDDQPSFTNNGSKWHRMVQIWDQFFVEDGVLYLMVWKVQAAWHSLLFQIP